MNPEIFCGSRCALIVRQYCLQSCYTSSRYDNFQALAVRYDSTVAQHFHISRSFITTKGRSLEPWSFRGFP